MSRFYRVGTEGSNLEFSITPTVKALLFINCVAFVVFSFAPIGVEWFGLIPASVVRGAIWQLLTYQFMHSGVAHILFNMLALWMFGTAIEGAWGSRRFLRYYLTCGVGAGICVVLVAYLLQGSAQQHMATVGASGAIFGILLAYGIMYPNNPIWMFFLFRVPAKYAVMIWGAIELFGFTVGGDAVSHVAHLGGLLAGYLYMRLAGFTGRSYAGSAYGYGSYRRSASQRFTAMFSFAELRAAYDRWNRRRLRKKFEVYLRKRDGGDSGTIH